MTVTITQLYNLLSEKVGKETAESLTNYSEEKISTEIREETKSLATKEDVANAKTDMIKWFVGLFIALATMIIGLYLKK